MFSVGILNLIQDVCIFGTSCDCLSRNREGPIVIIRFNSARARDSTAWYFWKYRGNVPDGVNPFERTTGSPHARKLLKGTLAAVTITASAFTSERKRSRRNDTVTISVHCISFHALSESICWMSRKAARTKAELKLRRWVWLTECRSRSVFLWEEERREEEAENRRAKELLRIINWKSQLDVRENC